MDTHDGHHECCEHDHHVPHSHSHTHHKSQEDQPQPPVAKAEDVNIQEMLNSKIAELQNGSSKEEEEERKLGMRNIK
jgi:hypothetical protein